MFMRIIALVVIAASTAFAANDCKDRSVPPRCQANIFGDGPRLIDVPQRLQLPDGTIQHFIDNVWIDVHSDPKVKGSLPIVVLGPGAGRVDWANCYPDGKPPFSGATTNLANAGYLAIYVGYRIHGDGAPGVGTLKLRDNWTLDARSLLAAAQWARTCHEKGGEEVAFIGFSKGTWPAYWSVSKNKDLMDLQTCLDIRTIILAGESANYLSKSTTNRWNLGDWDRLSLTEKLSGAFGVGYRVLEAFSAPGISHLPQVQYEDLTSGDLGRNLKTIITQPTIDLMEATLFEEADKSLDGCYELQEKPPICSERCFNSTVQKFAVGLEKNEKLPIATLEKKSFWVKPAYSQAAHLWGPTTQVAGAVCPTRAQREQNRLLDAWYEQSPVCSATKELKTKRALQLLSHYDQYYDPRAQWQLCRSLKRRGIARTELKVPDIQKDHGFQCGHFDYFKPDLRNCGWVYVKNELTEAFRQEPMSTGPELDNLHASYKSCP